MDEAQLSEEEKGKLAEEHKRVARVIEEQIREEFQNLFAPKQEKMQTLPSKVRTHVAGVSVLCGKHRG